MKYPDTPPKAVLDSLLEYRDGVLYWKQGNGKTIKVGTRAGTVMNTRYTRIRVYGGRYQAHRLIWKMFKGEDASGTIDHINRDRNDNRIENLRDVSNAFNCLNTGACGASYHNHTGKFQSQITINGKKLYLGIFDTEEEAALRYQEFKELYMEMLNA